MNFEFAAPAKIMFGTGVIEKLGATASQFGKKALIVSGVPFAIEERIQSYLASSSLEIDTFSIDHEPSIALIEAGIAFARQVEPELIIGLGGGSAMDAAKAIAILLKNPGEVQNYLEVVGLGQSLTQPGLPVIAIPTTAGTGSEVTSNAVINAPAGDGPGTVKVSLRSPLMLARVALVDPTLTLDLPAEITAQTGLDALTQLIEPYLSNRANPITDGLCLEGMKRAARSLRDVYTRGSHLPGRTDLSVASLFGGLALANAKLGAVHGFAGPIGGLLSAPHGAICARLLPLVMQMNLSALLARQPDSPAIPRFTEIARILTGKPDAQAGDGVAWIAKLVEDLNIPQLSQYGMKGSHIPRLCAQAEAASSMQGNAIKLSLEELEDILQQAIQ